MICLSATLAMADLALIEYEGKECPVSDLNTITIQAPPDFVYPYISDGDKISLWSHDDRLLIEFPRGTQARIGMQIRFTITVPTDPWWLVEITELETGQVLRTQIVDGIFRGKIEFFTSPDAEGHTVLEHRALIVPQGKFMQFAWKTIGAKIHADKMDEILQRIKTLVEKDWAQKKKRK